MRRARVAGRLDPSGVTVRVTAGVTPDVAPTEGGVQHRAVGGCNIPPVYFGLSLFGFFVLARLAEPRQRGGTRRERPPRVCRWRGTVSGGVQHRVQHPVQHTPPATGGSLPSGCIPAGRLSRPPRRASESASTRCAMLDRFIRVCIVIGGVTGVCAVTWPGPFPAGDPGRCCMNTRCGWGGVARTSRDPPQEPHYKDEVEGPSHI